MQSHEVHGVAVPVLTFPRLQGRQIEKRLQGRRLRVLYLAPLIQRQQGLGHKLPGSGDELVEVFPPGHAPLTLFPAMELIKPGQLHHVLHRFVKRQLGHGFCQIVDQREEAREGRGPPATKGAIPEGLARRRPKGAAPLPSLLAQLLQGFLPNAPGRRIHHALEGRVRIPVQRKAQISQGVTNFHAFEEAKAPVDSVGDIASKQCFFQISGLRVRAIKNRDLVSPTTPGEPFANAVCDEAGLIQLVIGRIEGDGIARFPVGPQILPEAIAVVPNQRIGGGQNIPRRSVVLLKPHQLHVAQILLEAMDVLNPGSAPAVDGLVIVAHGGDMGAATGENPEPGILDGIGVLEFVHQDMSEAFASSLLRPLGLLEYRHSEGNHVVEVQKVGSPQGALIVLE